MGFAVLHYNGSKVIFLVEVNLHCTMAITPPQGSMLGPLLFFFYTSMTCVMCQRPWISSILFAVDTNYFSLIKTEIN